MQSISELLESFGYEARDGCYVKGTITIAPAQWSRLSPEGFRVKAEQHGWLTRDRVTPPEDTTPVSPPWSAERVEMRAGEYRVTPHADTVERTLCPDTIDPAEDIGRMAAIAVRRALIACLPEKRRADMTLREKVAYVSVYGRRKFEALA